MDTIRDSLGILVAVIAALDARSHLGPFPVAILTLVLDLTKEEWNTVQQLGLDLDLLVITPGDTKSNVGPLVGLTAEGSRVARGIGKILSN